MTRLAPDQQRSPQGGSSDAWEQRTAGPTV